MFHPYGGCRFREFFRGFYIDPGVQLSFGLLNVQRAMSPGGQVDNCLGARKRFPPLTKMPDLARYDSISLEARCFSPVRRANRQSFLPKVGDYISTQKPRSTGDNNGHKSFLFAESTNKARYSAH